MIASPKERRRSPRADSSVPLKISCDDFDIVTESKNLSSSGAYCTVQQYLEPMTKLKIQLLLPCVANKRPVVKKISCHGVVVRTHAHDKNFSVAIYFNDIQERDQKLIADHIVHFLKERPAGS